jgi:hypothetical protein
MNNAPPYEETKQLLLDAGKSEDWIEKEQEKIDQMYGGIDDAAFKIWLVASHHGMDAGEIKMEDAAEGEEIQLAQVTDELVQREMKKDISDKTMYAVQGTVLNIRHGETRKGGDKTEFTLVDETGRQDVALYNDATEIFANARISEGDYIHIPQCNISGFYPGDEDEEDPFLWRRLVVPPFGDIRKMAKDADSVFKNIEQRAAKEDDPVMVIGIPTHIDKRSNDACSVCGRWIQDDDENRHEDCRDEEAFEVVKQVDHDVTVTTRGGQTYKVGISYKMGSPDFEPMEGLFKFRGFWQGEYGTVQCYSYESAEAEDLEDEGPAPSPSTSEPEPEQSGDDPNASQATSERAESATEPDESQPTPPPDTSAGENSAVPDEVLDTFENLTEAFGGENRVLVLVNNLVDQGVVKPTEDEQDLEDSELDAVLKERARGYVETAVEEGYLAYVHGNEKTVQWTGDGG